jgi:hypothetical protein
MLIFTLLVFAAFFVVSGIFVSIEAKRRKDSRGLERKLKSTERRPSEAAAMGRAAIPNRN